MWLGQKVSVILPTYNERDSIRQVILDFEAIEYVDEIIVINNNAAPGTSEEVAKTSATEYRETTQGYGAAIQRGFAESSGDLVAVFEPDGTFVARDLIKLLAYSENFDVVYGSRTVKEFIWQGANMGRSMDFTGPSQAPRWAKWDPSSRIAVPNGPMLHCSSLIWASQTTLLAPCLVPSGPATQ